MFALSNNPLFSHPLFPKANATTSSSELRGYPLKQLKAFAYAASPYRSICVQCFPVFDMFTFSVRFHALINFPTYRLALQVSEEYTNYWYSSFSRKHSFDR